MGAMRRGGRAVPVGVAILLAALAALRFVPRRGEGERPPGAGGRPPAAPERPPSPFEEALAKGGAEALVSRVYDGDTVLLESGEHVRLLGVDAPETHHPEKPAQPHGEAAAAFVRERVEGKRVRFLPGPSPRDGRGRVLARVVLPDGAGLEEALVREGLAVAMPRFAGERAPELLRLEAEARREGKGIWSDLLDPPEAARLMLLYGSLDEAGRQRAIDALEGIARDEGRRAKGGGGPPAAPGAPVSWQEAERRPGETLAIEGRVLASRNTGRVCFLNFHREYRKHLSVVIFASDFHKFPGGKPEEAFQGRKIRVTGRVEEYDGRLEVKVSDPAQIEVVQP